LSYQEWNDKESSRGATTEAALSIFNAEQLSKSFEKGVQAAR